MGIIISTLITSYWEISLSLKLLSLLTLLVIHNWMRNSSFKKKYRLPPGPKHWPILGNLPEIVKTVPWDYYESLRKTYGDIVLCQLGMTPTVVISGLKFFIEAFVTNDKDFSGRMPIPSFDPLFCDGKDIVMAPRITPQWTAQRLLLHKVIRKFVAGQTFQKCIENATKRYFKLIDGRTEPQCPQKDICRLVLNMMFSLLFGEDFEYDDPLFLELEKKHHEVHQALLPGLLESMFPFTKYLPYLPGRNTLKRCGYFKYKLYEDRIVQKLKDKSWEDGESLIDQLIKLMKQSHNKEIGYKLQIADVIAVLVDFEAGSTDTTEFTSLWTLLLILKNPDVQKKIHDELDSVLGDKQLLLAEYDREYLPYLTAVVRESMRTRHILYNYVPHVTTCDTKLGGFDIPEGTNIVINVDSIHLDKEAWGDPEVFRPERFLDEAGDLLPKPDHFVPFSAGRRVCAGEVMGKQMVNYLLSRIFQRYTIEAGPGEIVDIDPILLGTGRVPKPFNAIFKRRR